MDADRVLAFRLARSGLATRQARDLAGAAAWPASDFTSRRGAAGALGAGRRRISTALYGRALIARKDDELGAQLGRQVQRLAAEEGFAPTEALAEVASATKEALARGRALDKNELHEELRGRVREELMPWCRGCRSHHVAPMLWRYATVQAGVRLDFQRRYRLAKPGRTPSAREALRRFLSFYGPARPADFAEWAGLARSHAQRLWDGVANELAEVRVGKRGAWLLRRDRDALESPPAAEGVRLLPPGDPYLQKPNRELLAPDSALRKRLFRPVASPGAVLRDGHLAGLWRVKAKGKGAEIAVERLGRLPRADLEAEAQRVAELRGAAEAKVVLT